MANVTGGSAVAPAALLYMAVTFQLCLGMAGREWKQGGNVHPGSAGQTGRGTQQAPQACRQRRRCSRSTGRAHLAAQRAHREAKGRGVPGPDVQHQLASTTAEGRDGQVGSVAGPVLPRLLALPPAGLGAGLGHDALPQDARTSWLPVK